MRGPVPRREEVIPDGIFQDSSSNSRTKNNAAWDTWKKTRLRLVRDPNDEIALMETCAAWFDPALADRLADVLLSGPHEPTWRVSAASAAADDDDDDDDANADERPIVRVSCAKWETTCVLARAIALDFDRVVAEDTPIDERRKRARRMVACSRKAAESLETWWTKGNGARWSTASDVPLPPEANVAYFETTRDLGEILHDTACVDTIIEPTFVCDKSFTEVVLGIVARCNELVERAAERAPECVYVVASTTCDAIVASLAEKIVQAAVRLKTLAKPCVAWNHVASWKDARLKRIARMMGASSSSSCDTTTERTCLDTLRQFQKYSSIEAHDEPLEGKTAREAWGAVKTDYEFDPLVVFSWCVR